MDQPLTERRKALAALFWLWLANCAAAWLLELLQAHYAVFATFLGGAHFWMAYFSHLALFMLLLTALLCGAAIIWPRKGLVLCGLAPLLAAGHILLYLDRIIYDLGRWHFNLVTLKFLTTPGVEDNLQFSGWQVVMAVGLVLACMAVEILAARGLWLLIEKRPALAVRLRRHAVIAAAALIAVTAAEKSIYAVADVKGRREVLVNSRILPFYLPLTCKRLVHKFGIEPEKEYKFEAGLALRYPRKPLELPAEPRRLNIVWIAVEQWRADAFTPQISPRTWRFGQRCLVGERHYSSGNDSRYGIFGMFYGLHGFYWDPLLAERRGPVFLKALKDLDYEVLAMGSANFNNPEFRLTCFADLSAEEAFDRFKGLSPERDLAMTGRFKEFLDRRPAGARPFFCFMFLDSPHSYRFQELPGFSPPFASDAGNFVSYERLAGDARERERARSRYLNSIAYSDFLIGGVLDDLERRGLLESTIVMIAGDHGEEFGESGLCGHNSAFNDWQTRTAFIFHYPGVKPGRLGKLTSHADWAPTTLGLLGVRSPPGDYCQGLDLLGAAERDYAVAASWSEAAVITAEGGRMVFPLEYYRLSTLEVYDGQRRPLADRDGFLARHGGQLRAVLESAREFRR